MHATSDEMVLTPPRVSFCSLVVIGRFRSFRFISFHFIPHFQALCHSKSRLILLRLGHRRSDGAFEAAFAVSLCNYVCSFLENVTTTVLHHMSCLSAAGSFAVAHSPARYFLCVAENLAGALGARAASEGMSIRLPSVCRG